MKSYISIMARNIGLIHNQTISFIFIIDFQIKKNKDFYNNYYIWYRCRVMFYSKSLWDGECITEKRGSWELQCRWKWRDKVVIRPRHMHVAVAVHNVQKLLQPKKGFFGTTVPVGVVG